jgi:hypothetical protein
MSLKLNKTLAAERKKWLKQFEDKCLQSPENDRHKFFFESVCPRCGKQHQVYINWTGRGKPRIYCELCRPAVAHINTSTCDPFASGIYQGGKRQVYPQAE